jgi:ribosomal protein S18 acetylase RimI-like enzyme
MLQKPDKKEFNQIFQLLQDSFPVDEYRTYKEQKALLEQPEYQIYVYKHQPDTITALLAVWEFDTLVFVEHFAVHSSYRNRGIGGRMLDELLQRFGKRVCLEVEPPVDSMTSGRVAFYERHGFFLNHYPYMQPAMSEGKCAIPLLVMTYGDKVNEEEFEVIKQTLYTRVYKEALT